MSKPIYKPTKPYQDDLNDLVQDDILKGGPGSGVKGHKTNRPSNSYRSLKDYRKHEQLKSGRLDQARGALKYFDQQREQAHARQDSDAKEYYAKFAREATSVIERILAAGSADMQKGGKGSGVKGHRTAKPASASQQPKMNLEAYTNALAQKMNTSVAALKDLGDMVSDMHQSGVTLDEAVVMVRAED